MSAQEILTLAQQGNPIAIATLLNYLTQRQGMKVRVQRQGDRLHVLLEAGSVPNPHEMMAMVQDSINELHVQGITSITVYGRQRGNRLPAWQQTTYLKTEAELSDRAVQPFTFAPAGFTSADEGTDANQASADFLDPLPLDPPPLPMESSETPDILKRPEAIVLLLFAALLIFWDAYTSLLEEDDVVPTAALSTSQLARRLQANTSTVRRRKRLADFGEWTRNLDPDGIAWTYRKGIYIPRGSDVSLVQTE